MNDIIVFSSCYLPENSLENYQSVMDHLFRYINYQAVMLFRDLLNYQAVMLFRYVFPPVFLPVCLTAGTWWVRWTSWCLRTTPWSTCVPEARRRSCQGLAG